MEGKLRIGVTNCSPPPIPYMLVSLVKLHPKVSGVSSRAFQKHRSMELCVPKSDKGCVLSSV